MFKIKTIRGRSKFCINVAEISLVVGYNAVGGIVMVILIDISIQLRQTVV